MCVAFAQFAASRTIFRRATFASAAVARLPAQITRVSSSAASPMESKGPFAAAASLSTSVADSNGQIGRFELSSSSSLVISKGDITVWSMDGSTDAIVNAAENRMLGGGGVDGAIHRAAGPDLKQACWNVPEVQPGVRCPTGEARMTPGFHLPVSRVIHTVGPIYVKDKHPEVSLRNSYRSCFKLAKENGIQYIAFPAISCGVYGYPYKEAARIAVTVVKEFANDCKEAHFVLFKDDICKVWLDTANELI